MPRPVEESRFRRILSQVIMWVILGATIAAAALMNQTKQHGLKVVLDAPKTFEGFSIRLPKNWEDTGDTDERTGVVLENPSFDERLSILIQRPTVTEIFNRFMADGRKEQSGILVGNINIAGESCRLMRRMYYIMEDRSAETELSVSRRLNDGRLLTISLTVPGMVSPRDKNALDHEIDLIKQVAASVELTDSPTTKPQAE